MATTDRRSPLLCSLLFLSVLLSVGCKRLPNPFEGERVLARAGKETLREMDVERFFPAGLTGDDSVKWLENYVDRWVRNHLKLQEARRLFGEDAADAELIEEYRNSLITRRLEDHLVDSATGDSLYNDNELREYYEQHLGDFVLDRSIVKGRVVAFPTNFRQKARLETVFASWSGDNRDEALAMASKNGFTLREIDQWTEFSLFLDLLPTRRNVSYDDLLGRSGVQRMTEGSTTWLFVISESRTAGQTKPFETVSEIVGQAVATRRRAGIIRAAEDSIYKLALLEKRAVINL